MGLSGGVDSSVAAAIMKEMGHEVSGAIMRIWPGDLCGEGTSRHACYGPSEELDVEDAHEVADRLGIPLFEIDLKQAYKTEVLDYFRTEYLLGRTPNPCVRCNKRVKFDVLLKQASYSGVNFDFFATGHYVKVKFSRERDRYILSKAVDGKKDQSYFLYSLSQEQLSRSMFPIGDYSKQQVRDIAAALGLVVSDKAESQDFADSGYAHLMGGLTNPGPIINMQGEVLGLHRGIAYYTVGQRRGLGISSPHPLYVIAIDHVSNSVVIGSKSEVWAKGLVASGMNWIAINELDRPIHTKTRIRSTHQEASALVTPLAEGMVHVGFEHPQMAVAPGQAVVFYDGDELVGGGTIDIIERCESHEIGCHMVIR